MINYQLKCINRSGNPVNFGIYQQFRRKVDSITPPTSLIWLCNGCNPRVSTVFTWSDAPLLACGKWQNRKDKSFTSSMVVNPEDKLTNAVQLVKKNGGFLFEFLPKTTPSDTLSIEDGDSLVRREAFVGLGMASMEKGEEKQTASIIFEAQSNLCHCFYPVVDYYLTYGNDLEVGMPITEFHKKVSLKLRFPVSKMIGVLRSDNTLAQRRDDSD